MMDTKLIKDIWKDCPKSIEELEKLSLYSILLVLGGYISIGIGSLHFLLTTMEKFQFTRIFYFIINLIFGFGLLLSYHRIKVKTKKWAIVGSVFSLVLIALGGIVGALAGIVSLLGAILAILATYDKNFGL